ncbi:RtcB family protein [Shinella zoogloeoides]|uniref:RtcB family protein n=1 Tax=Shinella zoogloeoides TaxID=352475 RepID=UPI00299E25A4|nr:RtcB family protein [Shinella zoogloeoides]
MTGKDLIDAGAKPGRWFPEAIATANKLIAEGLDREKVIPAVITEYQPAPQLPLRDVVPMFQMNIRAENPHEAANVSAVFDTMEELMRTPVVTAGAVMPDACPAGPRGTIPVGGVVASRAIHPGMHSADICCSMALTVVKGASPAELLDAVHRVTHFGPGGRKVGVGNVTELDINNPFLRDARTLSPTHFGTQGDGNHFAYVGTLRSTGETTLVTHHGSRGPGAALYKAGMRVAERYRQQLSPDTLKQNAWIPANTRDGELYWEALQAIRQWTKDSHFAIHDMALLESGGRAGARFWNEHNFVFRKSDGLFYHAKGATPAFDGWAADATDLTIIPLNMAEPILIVRGRNADNGLGFSPHGAGRNFSRTQHRRLMEGRTEAEIFAEETKGIDARFFMGIPDISELPSAYKNAAAVRAQIDEFGLADVVDEVIPYGCIMAGDWEKNAPWRKK